MKIAIRLDDISYDMNWEKFLRFKRLLDNHGIKPLIGVIPDNGDPMLIDFRLESQAYLEQSEFHIDKDTFFDYIRELRNEGWIIAMHGLNHVYTTDKSGIFPLNNFSEFSGLPYDEQYEALAYGRQLLETNGIKTDIFMAPAHNYDNNTLKALKELEFDKITDGFGNRPYKYKDITFYPISFQKSRTIKMSKKKISSGNNLMNTDIQPQTMARNEKIQPQMPARGDDEIETDKADAYSTIVFHTNTMNERDFENAERIFSENECISFDEYLKVSARKRGAFGHIKEYLMAKTKHLITLQSRG